MEKLAKGDSSEQEINRVFKRLLEILKTYLNLDSVNSNVRLIYDKNNDTTYNIGPRILDLGVKRRFQNGTLVLEISQSLHKFLPFILLREAYYFYTPQEIKNNREIKLLINFMVEISLRDFETVEEWRRLIRNQVVDDEFLAKGFYGLEKFMTFENIENAETASKLVFDYVRNNYLALANDTKDLPIKIEREFGFMTSKLMRDDELVETIRVLKNIFYKVREFQTLLDLKNMFNELKKVGQIDTTLSLRKFSSHIEWLSKFSLIGPSYHYNTAFLGYEVVCYELRFNPLVPKSQIAQIINNMPFLEIKRFSEHYFAIEISGYFVLPTKYIKGLYRFLDRLEQSGYIIKKTHLLIHGTYLNCLNLNYFRNFYKDGRLLNPKHKFYDKKYEATCLYERTSGGRVLRVPLLEFLVLKRLRYASMGGLSFEHRNRTLRTIKSDFFYLIRRDRRNLARLKNDLWTFQEDPELQDDFLRILENNQKFGFFYTKELLEGLVFYLDEIHKVATDNPDITNPRHLEHYIERYGMTSSISRNLYYNNKEMRDILQRIFLPLYFQNKKEFLSLLPKYRRFVRFLKISHNVKIFNPEAIKRIIEDKQIALKIYNMKERKINALRESYNHNTITSKLIYEIVDKYLNHDPPIIMPELVNTINTTGFAKYHLSLILNDNENTRRQIHKLQGFFPRTVYDAVIDKGQDFLHLQFFAPLIKEKELLVSILFNLFGQDLLSVKRYFFVGLLTKGELLSFYDPEIQGFFYTPDLFEHYFLYVQKIIGPRMKPLKETPLTSRDMFWSKEKSMETLCKAIDRRKSQEKINFDIMHFKELTNFHHGLREILLSSDQFSEIKKTDFYKQHIQSIKFKPMLQKFGLGQYYLYIRPSNMNEVDLKLLFLNTFQRIQHPAWIDDNPSLFIKSIYPYRSPNKAYLNWAVKSKRTISEYCLFFIKKVHFLLHFDYNLNPSGWDVDKNQFKGFVQKILFEPNFRRKMPTLKYCNMSDLDGMSNYQQQSHQFSELIEVYNTRSMDIKSVLGTKNYQLIDKIQDLLKNHLIYPYIKLKNLDFRERFIIILPDLKKEQISTLIKVFSFFNYGCIYEIEGEFFINGFYKEKVFEHGLMIKLYLPLTEFDELKKTFNLVFQFLQIPKYLIMYDMVENSNIIKSVYGDISFLKTYNPLNNLNWNKKDKIWVNPKIFTEKFEPIYPKLVPDKDTCEKKN